VSTSWHRQCSLPGSEAGNVITGDEDNEDDVSWSATAN